MTLSVTTVSAVATAHYPPEFEDGYTIGGNPNIMTYSCPSSI